MEWENPFAAKRSEDNTVLHLSKNEEKDDDLIYLKFKNFKQLAAQIINKHEEHAFLTAADTESSTSYQPPPDAIIGPAVYPLARQNPQPTYKQTISLVILKVEAMLLTEDTTSTIIHNRPYQAWTESGVMLVLPANPGLCAGVFPAIKFTHTFVSEMCKDAALAKELRDLSLCSAIPISARPFMEAEVHYSGNTTIALKIMKVTNQLYNEKVEFEIPSCPMFGTTIIDTGASACCINKKVIPEEALEPLTQTVFFNGLNSRQQATHRIKQGSFLIKGNKFKIPLIYAFEITDINSIKMLIGANLLRSMKGGIRIKRDEITIYKKVTGIKTSNQTEIAEIAELEVSEEEFLEINESIYFNQEGKCIREMKQLAASALYSEDVVLQSPYAFKKNMKITCGEQKKQSKPCEAYMKSYNARPKSTLENPLKITTGLTKERTLEFKTKKLEESSLNYKPLYNDWGATTSKPKEVQAHTPEDNMYRYNRKGFLEYDDSSDDSISIVDLGWDDYYLSELKLNHPIPCCPDARRARIKAFSYNALADLGASINLMPYSLYAKLSLETLKPTKMSVRLANQLFQHHIGLAKNMLVEVGKFTFLVDFVILEMEEDSKVPLILGSPFLHTADAVIRVKQKQLNLGVGTEGITLSVDYAMKHSYSNDDTRFRIDVMHEILEEDFDALLNEESKILHSIEGTILKEKLFVEFDEFTAMTADENSESDSETKEPMFGKITFNIDYKIKNLLKILLLILN
nr:reverse transcriptase domain-containing protein [Tanacetum cinerariifolium]